MNVHNIKLCNQNFIIEQNNNNLFNGKLILDTTNINFLSKVYLILYPNKENSIDINFTDLFEEIKFCYNDTESTLTNVFCYMLLELFSGYNKFESIKKLSNNDMI